MQERITASPVGPFGLDPAGFDPAKIDPSQFDPAGWLAGHVAQLWHTAVTSWPRLSAVALAALLVVMVCRAGYRLAWRRTVSRGRWLSVVPPRTLDASRHMQVARQLTDIARAARNTRWRLIRPPLAVEIHAAAGRLRLGVWVPPGLPVAAVITQLTKAWPGAVVTDTTPPPLGGDRVTGYRLGTLAGHPDTGWLVDAPGPRPTGRRGGEPDPDLGSVYAALGDAGGSVVLQVLLRPAPSRHLARLAAAVRTPARPRRSAVLFILGAVVTAVRTVLLAVLELVTPGPARSPSAASGRVAPDAMQREAMNEARAKHRASPHVLVAVRAVAGDAYRGSAVHSARSVVAGYGDTSAWLRPWRLWAPRAALADRWARRPHWVLMSAAELGVLMHLPTDPALHGFATAALHRGTPVGVARPVPERAGRAGPGWTRRGWTDPPAHPADAAGVGQRTTPYPADDYDESAGPDEFGREL